jgi:hypothetical protein
MQTQDVMSQSALNMFGGRQVCKDQPAAYAQKVVTLFNKQCSVAFQGDTQTTELRLLMFRELTNTSHD